MPKPNQSHKIVALSNYLNAYVPSLAFYDIFLYWHALLGPTSFLFGMLAHMFMHIWWDGTLDTHVEARLTILLDCWAFPYILDSHVPLDFLTIWIIPSFLITCVGIHGLIWWINSFVDHLDAWGPLSMYLRPTYGIFFLTWLAIVHLAHSWAWFDILKEVFGHFLVYFIPILTCHGR